MSRGSRTANKDLGVREQLGDQRQIQGSGWRLVEKDLNRRGRAQLGDNAPVDGAPVRRLVRREPREPLQTLG
jgi:hypothetical protein